MPRTGLDALGQKRAVTRNHVAETLRLAADVKAGKVPAPDLVLWPENSSDLDPFLDATDAQLLSRPLPRSSARSWWAPCSMDPGTVTYATRAAVGRQRLPGADVRQAPPGAVRGIPAGAFGIQKIITRYAHDQPNDFLAGKTAGLFDIPGPVSGSKYRLGDVICFEVAYDGLVRDVVDHGAQLIVVQTNNASFGRSGETYQQLAMGRIRAVEHGRASLSLPRAASARSSARTGAARPQQPFHAAGAGRLGAAADLEDPVRPARGLDGAPPGRSRRGRFRLGGAVAADPAGRGPAARDPAAARRHEQTAPAVATDRVLVCIPTYNERDNLPSTLRGFARPAPTSTSWSSMTAALTAPARSPIKLRRRSARPRAAPHREVRPRHGLCRRLRLGPRAGLRRARRDGRRWLPPARGAAAAAGGARSATAAADLVLGSRWVDGGVVKNWPRRRLLLSRGGNAYVRTALGLPLRDATGGYRAYRGRVLRKLARWTRRLAGLLLPGRPGLAGLAGGLPSGRGADHVRRADLGQSKMSNAIVVEALWRVTWWGLRSRPTPPSGLALQHRSQPQSATHGQSPVIDDRSPAVLADGGGSDGR